MAAFPKKISVHGIEIEVESWDELDELVERYGAVEVSNRATPSGNSSSNSKSTLSASERSLLQMFLDNPERGILNRDLGSALGAQGKGIRPALDRWARRIGLVSEDGASAFETVNQGSLGRGFRMTAVHLSTARALLGGGQ